MSDKAWELFFMWLRGVFVGTQYGVLAVLLYAGLTGGILWVWASLILFTSVIHIMLMSSKYPADKDQPPNIPPIQ